MGGLIGGVAGLAGGIFVADRNYQFANRELSSQQRVDAANAQITRLDALAGAADATAAENRRKLDNLDRQYRAGQITAAEYGQRTESMRKDLEEMQKAVGNAKEMREELISSAGSLPQLQEAEERMGPPQRRLEASAAELDEMLQRVPTV